MPEKYSILYPHILHVYSLVSIDTLARMLNAFVKFLYKCHAICDMTVRMSEYSLMRRYSLVGCRIVILYDIINGRYVQTGNLSFL